MFTCVLKDQFTWLVELWRCELRYFNRPLCNPGGFSPHRDILGRVVWVSYDFKQLQRAEGAAPCCDAIPWKHCSAQVTPQCHIQAAKMQEESGCILRARRKISREEQARSKLLGRGLASNYAFGTLVNGLWHIWAPVPTVSFVVVVVVFLKRLATIIPTVTLLHFPQLVLD